LFGNASEVLSESSDNEVAASGGYLRGARGHFLCEGDGRFFANEKMMMMMMMMTTMTMTIPNRAYPEVCV